jgi:capsule polysaccharide export protein KpsE/RkpR
MESDKINQELKKKIMDRDDVILALRAQLDALNKTLQQLRDMSAGGGEELLNLQAKYEESMNMNLMLQEDNQNL